MGKEFATKKYKIILNRQNSYNIALHDIYYI